MSIGLRRERLKPWALLQALLLLPITFGSVLPPRFIGAQLGMGALRLRRGALPVIISAAWEERMVTGVFEELAVGGESARMYASGANRATARVVVFHPWWGLNDDVIAYADRLAGAGFSVVAPDLVRGRIASTIEDAERISNEIEKDHANAVALTAIDGLAGSDGGKIGVVGFSMGPPWAIWCPTMRSNVSASVIYYGTVSGPSLSRARVPVLGHFAESDPCEPFLREHA
jgi:carboxymethylenebutenolidase